MKKKRISSYLVFISVATFISIFALVAYQSYNSLLAPSARVVGGNLLRPIDPKLDTQLLLDSEKLEKFTELPQYSTPSVQLVPTVITVSPTGTAASTPTQR